MILPRRPTFFQVHPSARSEGEGVRIIANIGGDGHNVGGEGTMEAAVAPSSMYDLAIISARTPGGAGPCGYRFRLL
jgi:hypothetical protein